MLGFRGVTAARVSSALVVLLAAFLAAWAIRADDSWFSIHWSHYACYVDETTPKQALAARAVAFVLSLLLIFIVRPRVARVSGASWLRVLMAVGASLVVCELVLRWRDSRHLPPPPGPPPGHYMTHTERQSVDFPTGGRIVHYTTDEHGYRVRDESTSVDLARPSIIIAGESVAFGFGLEYDETVGARLASRFGTQDVNIAISEMSTARSYGRIRDELEKLKRPVAVVTFIVHTWLERETNTARWHVEWDGTRQLTLLPPTPQSRSPLLNLFHSVIPYRDDHRFDVARLAMVEIAELARSRGAVPLFVLTECGARCRSTEFIDRELTRGLSAPWVSVPVPESANIPGDMHPSAASVVAYVGAIENELRRNGVSP